MGYEHSKWYISRGDKEYGPIAHRELLLLAGLGKLHPDDQVWMPGFEDWQAAGQIPGLLAPPHPSSRHTVRANNSRYRQLAFRRLRRAGVRLYADAISLFSRIQITPSMAALMGGAALILIVTVVARTSEQSFATDAPRVSIPSGELSTPVAPMRDAETSLEVPVQPRLVTSLNSPARASDETHVQPLASLDLTAEVKDEAPESPATLTEDSTPAPSTPLPTKKETPEQSAGAEPAVPKPLRSLDAPEGVRSVQQRLNALGYLSVTPTGTWGPRSKLALKRFQFRAKIASSNGWNARIEKALFDAGAPRERLARATAPASASISPLERPGGLGPQ